MYLPPLQPSQNAQICVSGNVTIHPSAAIAPGVLLQADEGSQIIVGSGVCIGMGVVIQSRNGLIAIEDGASLGAGVLLIGCGCIGPNVCIGPSSTLINCSVEANVLIPPGSLLGDRSRTVELAPPEVPPRLSGVVYHRMATTEAVFEEAAAPKSPSEPFPSPWDDDVPTNNGHSPESSNSKSQPEASQSTEYTQKKIVTQVYGHEHVQELLSALLPHRQSLDES